MPLPSTVKVLAPPTTNAPAPLLKVIPVAVRFAESAGASRVVPAKKSVSLLIGAVPPQLPASETLLVVPPPFQVRFAATAAVVNAASKSAAIPQMGEGFIGLWVLTKEK